MTTNIIKISDRLSIVHYEDTGDIGLSDSKTGQEVFFVDYEEATEACKMIDSIINPTTGYVIKQEVS